MNKDEWIKKRIQSSATFTSFLIVYGTLVSVFLLLGLSLT